MDSRFLAICVRILKTKRARKEHTYILKDKYGFAICAAKG